MGRRSLAVLVLGVVLVVVVTAHWHHRGHGGWGRSRYSRRSDWWGRWIKRCFCNYARNACRVERAVKEGGQLEVLKDEGCEGGATCSTESYTRTYNNATYKFFPCRDRKEYCPPVHKWHGRRWGWGWRRRFGRPTPTPAAETNTDLPQGGDTPFNQQIALPTATQSPAEDQFCDKPRWYVKACKITGSTDKRAMRDMDCGRGGTCSLGPGPYVYNGTAVTATFCQGCRPIMRPRFRPRSRPGGARPTRQPEGGRQGEPRGDGPGEPRGTEPPEERERTAPPRGAPERRGEGDDKFVVIP